MSARSNLETALSVINRPIPTSYLGIISGLLWSFFCHVLFQVSSLFACLPSRLHLTTSVLLSLVQLVIGRGAVYLASMFTRRRKDKAGEFESPKKLVFGVTFDDVAETYHLLHQINMACKCVGMSHRDILMTEMLTTQPLTQPNSRAWVVSSLSMPSTSPKLIVRSTASANISWQRCTSLWLFNVTAPFLMPPVCQW